LREGDLVKMDERIILSQIREFVNCDYPYEHLGIADKFRLSSCVREEIKNFEKIGKGYDINSTGFIQGVLIRMRNFGYKLHRNLVN